MNEFFNHHHNSRHEQPVLEEYQINKFLNKFILEKHLERMRTMIRNFITILLTYIITEGLNKIEIIDNNLFLNFIVFVLVYAIISLVVNYIANMKR